MIKQGFASPAKIYQNPDGKTFTLHENLIYTTSEGIEIVVPEGFVTDLASIPTLSRLGMFFLIFGHAFSRQTNWGYTLMIIGSFIIWISKDLRPYGKFTDAAILHDWCYSKWLFPQHKCDKILREAMKNRNTEGWEREVIFSAVYLFGNFSYRSKNVIQTTPKLIKELNS
jgi:hypothetical protein